MLEMLDVARYAEANGMSPSEELALVNEYLTSQGWSLTEILDELRKIDPKLADECPYLRLLN